MLVLTRKPGEKILLGNNVVVTVAQVSGNKVRISIEAPEEVRILRGELACWLEADGKPAAPAPAETSAALAGRA